MDTSRIAHHYKVDEFLFSGICIPGKFFNIDFYILFLYLRAA
jgi:hypothetical protein